MSPPQLLRVSAVVFPCISSLQPFFRNRHSFFFRPNCNPYFPLCSAHRTIFTTTVAAAGGRPGELLSSSIPSILDAAGDSTAFQTASTVLLTGAFTLFLFRTFRRRAKRAKQMRIRSSSAAENLKKASMAAIKAKSPPSPDEALLGALIAAAFGILLYKFTANIEYALNRQTLSDNYSVRQITITIRTIINGLCYLATFVFGFNSLGLFLYSGQLAMNALVEGESELKSSDSNNSETASGVEDEEDKSSGNSDKTQ
ncbi:uncharacterized protein LOC127240090 [Andrographis paniculata]|uniref:uncharacterized protein LOC127240090 n=1 Tax=Andrographis paniculata TaxID=175694 RepID=UPI0021E84C91|nr:uncharacterized protein LOC127240090 [Andrographis paniculata]XP_051114502.1 uncharacterized protein LOC127240090 [Andrographis paniculata]